MRVRVLGADGVSAEALDAPTVEARGAYFKFEGGWGGITVGRSLGLFARGGILLDYDVEHGHGPGFPCGVKEVHGGACGHAGFGLLFPGFHSGFVYNTPTLAGSSSRLGSTTRSSSPSRTIAGRPIRDPRPS